MTQRTRIWTLALIGLALAAAVLALLLAAPPLVRAANRDVCGTCTYHTIQAAIDDADPGDTVRVATGTYNETLWISKSLTLEGGWNDTFTVRNPRTSVIDGAGIMPLAGAGPDVAVIPIPAVVNIEYPVTDDFASVDAATQGNYVGSGIEVIIDGFEIKNGNAVSGGGISVDVEDDCRVVINNNNIHDNSADDGGGIYADAHNRSVLEITNNRIFSNTASDDEGGLYAYVWMSGTLTLDNNEIISNTASDSVGGFYLDVESFAHFSVDGNKVMSNTANSNGGFYFDASYGCHGTFDDNQIVANEATSGEYGGGEMDVEGNSTTTFYRNEFRGNSASVNYGGLYLIADYHSQVTGGDLKLIDNRANTYGGGYIICGYGTALTLPDTRVTGNEATGGMCGGVLFETWENATIRVPDLYVYDNQASLDEGGVAFETDGDYGHFIATNAQIISNTAQAGSGGGAYVYIEDGGSLDLTGSRFERNTASADGAGLYVSTFDYASTIVLSDTEFLSNTAQHDGGGAYFSEGPEDGSYLELSNSEFISNTAATGNGGGAYIGSANHDGTLTADNGTFRKNVAGDDGGALYLGDYNDGCTVSVQDGTFEHNEAGDEADDDGGAIYFVSADVGTKARFDGNTFTANEAGGSGGAFYGGEFSHEGAWASFSGNTLERNRAGGDGGAVFLEDLVETGGEAYFNDNTIEDNEAGGYGGGAVVADDYFGYEGSISQISGNTVSNNVSGGYGAGLYLDQAESGCRVEFRDNVITGNVISSTGGYYGGGVYIDHLSDSCVMWMTGNEINDNVSTGDGGGIYWEYDGLDNASVGGGAVLYFEDNELQRNWAGDRGGGCYFEGYITEGAGFYFNRNLVNDNTALEESGGCHFDDDFDDGNPIEFVGNQFNGNTAAEDNGALYFSSVNDGTHMRFWDNQVIGNRAGISDTVYADGTVTAVPAVQLGGYTGGICISSIQWGGVVDMQRNQILSNTAYLADTTGGDVGGLYADMNTNSGRLTMVDNTIAGNRAEDSFGGLFIEMEGGSRLVMVHNTIQANTAVTESGGLWIGGEDDSQYFLRRNKILDNVAGTKGGLWIENTDTTEPLWGLSENNLIAGNQGSGIYVENTDFWSTNDTIADNGAYGLLITTSIDISATAWLSNAIVWGHTDSFVVGDPANCAVNADYSDIEDGYAGTDNLNADPLFVNAAANDYHLQDASPAIDVAHTPTAPPIDLDGIPRPVPAGGEADMGCYEWFLAGVTLEPDQTGSARPGDIVTYDLTVTNDGNLPDTFDLTIYTLDLLWPATLSTDSVTLDPGASTTIQVQVTVPAGTDAGTVANMGAMATSRARPTVLDIATLVTTAELAPAVSLEPDRTAGGLAGSAVVYEHTLTNLSNGTETFLLTASSSQGWTVSFSAAAVSLAKGDSTTIKVYVSIPSDAPLGTVDVTTVTATASTDNTVSDSVTDTTTREAAPFNVLLPTIMRNH